MKLITAKVIKDGRILEGPHEYIAAEEYDRWMRRGLPRQWDVLITTEAPLGEVAMLRDVERVALAQRVILLRGNPGLVDQRYLFQALKSPFVRGELAARATGTTVLGIKQSELRKVRIPYYSTAHQHRISGILSAYDDLIENNTRRIRILEEMAQALYREWFVHFRFPGHAKVRKVESALGPILEGWEVKPLGAIAEEVRQSVSPNHVESTTPYVGLEHIPRKSIALSEWGNAAQVSSTKLAFRRGQILFGKIRPYFHKVAVAPVDGVCSSDTIVIAPKDTTLGGLVLGCVSSEEFVAHATKTSKGTKMPRADWGVLSKYPVAVAPAPVLALFNSFMDNAVDQICNFVFRNRNLRTTRDLLLPKLISGELDVSRLELPATGEPQ